MVLVSLHRFIVPQLAKNLPDSIAYSQKYPDEPPSSNFGTNFSHACYMSSPSRKSLLQYLEKSKNHKVLLFEFFTILCYRVANLYEAECHKW
jgi:hypothetical protein